MTKEELSALSYPELQEMAKLKEIPYVGIAKIALVKALAADEATSETDTPSESVEDREEIPDVLGEKEDYVPEEVHTQQEVEAKRAEAEKEKHTEEPEDSEEPEDYAEKARILREAEAKKLQAEKAEVPKIATTENYGKEDIKPVKESVPVVQFKTKTVRIKPKKNIPRSYIGTNVWELKAGKVYEVPEEVAEIFENGGYL